jgi:hypothetical protein
VSAAFPPIVLLILVAVLNLFFLATYVTHRRARYHQRLEDAYSRIEQIGAAGETKATA